MNEEGREEEGEDVAARIGPCRRWDRHQWPSTPPEMEKKTASVGGREGGVGFAGEGGRLYIYIERREGRVCFKGNKDDFGYLKPKLAIVYSF